MLNHSLDLWSESVDPRGQQIKQLSLISFEYVKFPAQNSLPIQKLNNSNLKARGSRRFRLIKVHSPRID